VLCEKRKLFECHFVFRTVMANKGQG